MPTPAATGSRPPRILARTLLAGPCLALALALPAGAQPESEHDWASWEKCESCHEKELMGDQVATWKQGPHHRAFETLRSEESRALAAELGLEGPAHESEACLSCHVSAWGVPEARRWKPIDPADGVQCESCHGPGRDYRKKKVMSEKERAVEKGLWEAGENEAICTACHNSRSPTFDPGRYTLPDGGTAGFDFEQAKERIAHPIPEHVKGRYLELEEAEKEKRRRERAPRF